MSTPARRPRRALFIVAGLLLLAAPAVAVPPLGAQSVTVHTGRADSTWIVDRVRLADARASVATQDRQIAIALLDTSLVLQFTDAGLSQLHQSMRDSMPQSFGARMVAQMVGAALGSMFDHGIACPLSAVREVRVDGGRLILEGRDGRRVFEHVEINGRDMMSDFAPDAAARFAAQVNRAIAR